VIRYLLHFLAITLLTVAAVGCGDAPKPRARVQAFAIDSLEFDTPELEKRFTDFDAAARQVAATGFEHRPYQMGGHFVAALWAKGIGLSEPCDLRGPRESLVGIHRILVETIVVPYPQAKAAGLRVEMVAPDPDGWCVFFDYREATKQGVSGPGWSITFLRWDADRYGVVMPFRPYDEARERITLPVRGYRVGDTDVVVGSQLPLEDDFFRYVRSADAMRDVYLADLARVEKRVVAFVQEHKVWKEVHRHDGRGLPLPAATSPLTPEEEKAELAEAKEFFTTQAKLMRDHHEAMYAAWRDSFPVERCWLELRKK
jgi:hypothetical protein